MEIENDVWVVHGVSADDPRCIHSVRELIDCVNELGFLPYFRNEIKGFSLEERTVASDWWSGDLLNDPWEWREQAARSGEVAYGKFFNKKAGFISLEWFPIFANYRRDGYDFDSLYEDGKARFRSKKIMDLYESGDRFFSCELKREAGFGKDGEKNFGGILTELQMQTYLVACDFQHRKNKRGEPYGMKVAIYTPPERMWGYDMVSSAYRERPQASFQKLFDRVKTLHPEADDQQIKKLLK